MEENFLDILDDAVIERLISLRKGIDVDDIFWPHLLPCSAMRQNQDCVLNQQKSSEHDGEDNDHENSEHQVVVFAFFT